MKNFTKKLIVLAFAVLAALPVVSMSRQEYESAKREVGFSAAAIVNAQIAAAQEATQAAQQATQAAQEATQAAQIVVQAVADANKKEVSTPQDMAASVASNLTFSVVSGLALQAASNLASKVAGFGYRFIGSGYKAVCSNKKVALYAAGATATTAATLYYLKLRAAAKAKAEQEKAAAEAQAKAAQEEVVLQVEITK